MTRLFDRATIAPVEFRVLGPLSAFSEGEPRKLGGKRQQMVLAVLLSTPNEVVSQDSLIDSVWSGLPPESAVTTLHSYVSNLRKLLGGSIDRDGSGYIARLEGSVLDSVEFERMSIEARESNGGDPQRALEAASSALSLWHGRAFGDLASEPALLNEAMRLDEQRLTTLEMRLEADIALGHHGSVVQELEALTREHPFRERLSGFLMLSLYRSGRQADALRVYQRVRAFLGDELGIEPSVDLQRLEDQILTQDPALDFLASAPTQVDRAARGYELREKIRDTRFGVLYRGFQGSVGREVSVLRLDEAISEDPKFVRRFETEMRAASELEHPHLIPIYDFWRDPEGAYLVTAFPHAGSLRDAIADEPWNISAVARLVDQLSSALSYVHRNGFVHGALAVDSVLLDDEFNAYISDLGLSGLRPGFVRSDSPIDDVTAFAELALTLLSNDSLGFRSSLAESRPDLGELDPVFQRAWHPDPASRYQKPEDFRRALLQAIGGDVVPAASEVPTGSRRNPYKGLRAFKESEAIDFHGRDSLTEELTEAISSRRLVAVVGPSGSGKSSLVRAGLLPALRSGAIAGSESWLIAEMFPGTHPFEELEAALVRVAAERPVGLIDELTGDARGLTRAAKKLIGNDRDEMVVLIDQFEELFSLVSSETNRRLFLDSLTAAAVDERSRLRFILTLRADFFDQPLQYPEFGEVLSDGLVAISPPSEEGLTQAIAQPARNVGVDLQPGLVTRIIDDVRDEPGGLPLMQYALTELFNSRVNNTMTLAAYEGSGGVAGALANRADEIYGDLSSEAKSAARNLFLRLVNVDEMADDTRRRVRQTELRGLSLDQSILEDVIQQFGAFRLLSFDRDAATRTPTIEVAHEALIREWDRLRTWIDERREDLLIHRRMQVTSRDWEDSEKDPSYLLRGSRLEQALIWQERTDIAITDDEMTFIEASIEQEKRDLAEYEALEAKVVRRRKALIGALAGGLLVAGVLGAVAFDNAQKEKLTAARATARELSAAAMDAIEVDPELGILLALEAIEATDSLGLEPVPEAASAIREALRRDRIRSRIPKAYGVIEFSPDGASVIADEKEDAGALYRWNLGGTEILASWKRSDSPVKGVAQMSDLEHSPMGDFLVATWAAPGSDAGLRNVIPVADEGAPGRNEMVAITIHDPTTLEFRRKLLGERGFYGGPTFSSSGLVASYFEGLDNSVKAFVWDPKVEEPIQVLANDSNMSSVQFIPASEILLTSHICPFDDEGTELSGLLIATEATTLEQVWRIETPGFCPSALSISPDGSFVVLNDRENRGIQVWDLTNRELVFEGPADDAQTLSWSPDSSRFAASGNDGNITIFDRDSTWHQSMILAGHDGSVFSTDFHPDGQLVASASLDENGLIWDSSNAGAVGDGAINVGGNVGQFFMGSDGQRMIVGVEGLGARTFDINLGSLISELPLVHSFHFVPTVDLSFVAALRVNGMHAVLDRSSGEVLFEPGDCLLPLAISQNQGLVVIDNSYFCPEVIDTESEVITPHSHVVNMSTGEVHFDLGARRLFKAMFSPQFSIVSESFLVVNVGNTVIEIYSIDDFELIATYSSDELENGGLMTLAIDPEGRYLGVGTATGSAVVIDVQALFAGVQKVDAVVFNRVVANGNVPQVRVSSQGLVVSSDFAGLYRVFDLGTGEELFKLRESGLESQGAAQFTWDGRQLAYEDALGNIRFTPLDTMEVVAQAQAVLTRTLTDDECTQYLHTDGCVDD